MGTTPQANHLVFSINLDLEIFELVVEEYYFPYSINKPLSAANSKAVIIIGGENFYSEPSLLCLTFSLKKGFQEFKGQTFEIIENYPPKYTEDYILIISFPKIFLKFNRSEGWITYTLSQKKKIQMPVKKINYSELRLSRPPLYKKGLFSVDADSLATKAETTKQKFSSSMPSRQLHTRNNSSRDKQFRESKPLTTDPNEVGGFFETTLSKRIISEEYYKEDEDEHAIAHNEIMNEGSNEFKEKAIENNQILMMDAFNIEKIIQIEDDDFVKISHKQALKLISLASLKLCMRKLTALDMNQISNQLDFHGDISIKELTVLLEEVLVGISYSLLMIGTFIKIIHKVLEKPRLKSSQISNIFHFLCLSNVTSPIDKMATILLITRIIKATYILQ